MPNNILQTLVPQTGMNDTILETIGYASPSGRRVTLNEIITECVARGYTADDVCAAIKALVEDGSVVPSGPVSCRSVRLGDTPIDDVLEAEDPWICEQIVACLMSNGKWASIQDLTDEVLAKIDCDEDVVFETIICMTKAGRLVASHPLDLFDEGSCVRLNVLTAGVSTADELHAYGRFAWDRDVDDGKEICHHLFDYVAWPDALTGMPLELITPFVTRGNRMGTGWPEGRSITISRSAWSLASTLTAFVNGGRILGQRGGVKAGQ
jgi:hypothetical protein